MLMIRMKTLFKTKPLKTSKYTVTFYMTVGNLHIGNKIDTKPLT